MAQNVLKKSGRIMYTDEVRKNIMDVSCCMCGIRCVMTTEQYIFKSVGSFVYDSSEHPVTLNPDWLCPECAAEVIRIKNLG